MKEVKNSEQTKGMIISAGIAALALLFVYAIDGFFPFGKGSIVALDLNSQYTPLLYRFYDVVTGVKNIAIDFHIGGGINLYSDTFTELINPFNYVLLLFGRTNIYKAVNVLLLMYVCVASVSAYYAINKLASKANTCLKIACSISYSMSYFVAYQYEIIRWMYIIVLFPLFMLALKRMLEMNKPVFFVIMQAYILMLSLQFGVQLCMFSFVYSVCSVISERRTTAGKEADKAKIKVISGHRCLITGLSLITSVLLAGPAILPAILNIMNSARSTQNSSILTVITHHGFDNILERIFEISNPLVMGIFIAALIVLKKDFIKSLKRCSVEVICMIIMIITVLFEPSNLLWHLGSYQCFPVRYGYAVVWLGIMAALELMVACKENVAERSAEEKLSNISKLIENEVYIILTTTISLIIAISLCGFIFWKRLMFAQAFSTLDISGVCKKETILLYVVIGAVSVMAVVAGLEIANVVSKKRFIAIFNAKMIMISALMGILWFMAILWPANSEARKVNEANYVMMNEEYNASGKVFVARNGYNGQQYELYTGHTREDASMSLNSALVSGKYSMSAYVPSGESLEYVSAMNKLGYDTPWISVSQKGGSELSDRLLGLEGEYKGAMLVTAEEMKQIKTIADFSELLSSKEPVKIGFDNKKGLVYINVNSALSGYVLLPMAYIKGWNASTGNITSYLGGLLAVEIDNSQQEIILNYSIPGVVPGFVLALFGLLLAALLVFVAKNSDTEEINNTGATSGDKNSARKFVELLDKIAKVVYIITVIAFAIVIYVLPNIGLVVFMGAKAAGKDITPYLEISKREDKAVHTLLSQTVEEDGIHILIGRNNLMNDKGVKVTSSDDESGYFRASKAADGSKDKDSRWSSANDWENNEHYLQADFKQTRNIQAVNIVWERTNASKYYIEVSEDGNNWNVVSEFGEPSISNTQTIYYENGIQGRYIRLHVTEVTKNEEDLSLYYQNVSVLEMEVYDDECDSFVIKTPDIANGVKRVVPVPEVPEGYLLKVGGVNYDNLLLDGGCFADNIAPVLINLGYELYCGDEKWDLKGFDIVLPSAEVNDKANDEEVHNFPFSKVHVREWKATDGKLEFGEFIERNEEAAKYTNEQMVEDLKSRQGNDKIKIETADASYLGDEGYEIEIKQDGIVLKAQNERGIYWGRVTLSKMIEENSNSWECGIIRDYPEYAVRGFVLDVARRPFSMEMLYEMLDILADNYMNTFQIHLSDNAIISVSDYDGTVDGARKLFSAYRLESEVEVGNQKLTSEFFYTNEEFSKFISDAKAMGIDVVPELDTPAHSLAVTKLFPEMGYTDYPELADTLDVSKPEVLDFAKKLWSEYLEGEALFAECNVVHLGMDEFYGDSDAYSKYIANLSTAVKDMAPDKTIRVWGSLSYSDVDTSALDRKVEMMVWNPAWSDPLATYEDGFGIINCLNRNLYIIVDGGNDWIDIDNLENNWEPNLFCDDDCQEEIPAWSPRMLGACYSMWNDNYCQNMTGPDDKGIMERFEAPVNVLSEKLWNR